MVIRLEELLEDFLDMTTQSAEHATVPHRLLEDFLGRCVEKLKALAISVMNQWPSLKLRVVDGWIENVRPGYPNDSLHYEGRAVDITTSDRDRSKIGMLARLAVEAGFDWVYYETKAHIHCSVKSESSQGARTGGCFTNEGTVTVESGGRKKLSDVRLGDRVLSYDTGSDKLVYSEVIMFLDRDTTDRKQFLRLGLSGGQVLTVTPQHLVMRNKPNGTDQDVEAVFAAHLNPSDQLLVAESNGTKLVRRTLLSSELVLDTGVIAPLTSVGTIVVDDVVASCYAVIESQSIAHFAFAPLRAIKSVEAGLGAVGRFFASPFSSSPTNATSGLATNAVSDDVNGVHWYPKTLYFLSNHFIPSYLLYDQ
ncbi:hypothetical protein GE061_017653 [Apolygus lucorum]|uniref:Protein hedgehog n=1 Tax=Apolygus lucorum TaxID=248454 RepID=A0A8S9XBG7_APOLU|nr:hypothetical protein GE061_017653 [Apolygus lucorum]